MKNLKKHFKEKCQLLLTDSQLVEIARAALEDCKPDVIGSHITEPIEIPSHGGNDIPRVTDEQL